jgi:hypothetical protein
VTDDGAVLTLDDGSVYSVDGGDQGAVSSWSSGDSVAVSDSGDAITNLSSGERASVTLVGDVTDDNTPSSTGDHTIQTKSDDGSIIVLDDGSIWIVDVADRANTSVWVDATSIVVNDRSGGDYELVDTDDQEIAGANYIGQE